MQEKNISYRTRVYYIVPSQELINEARLSNNLYNQTLYILKQAFTNEEKIPSKFDLINMLRHKEYDCIYLKPKGSNSVVLTNELVTVSVPNKYIRKVK